MKLSKVTAQGLVRLAVTTDSRDPGRESGWKATILGCLRLELAKYIVLDQGSIFRREYLTGLLLLSDSED